MTKIRWLIKRRHIFFVLLLTLPNFRECTSNKTFIGTIEKVSSLPKNEIEKKKMDESLNCGPNLTAIYALDPLKAETHVKCGQNKAIHGLYCPEFNEKGIQPKYSAPCTICNSTYMASESFKFPNCFKMYGGILSEGLRKEKENMQRQINEKNADILSLKESILRKDIIITLMLTLIFVFAMYVFCVRFWVRKYHYKEDIMYVDFLKTVFNACIKLRTTLEETNSRYRDEASKPMLQNSENLLEGNNLDSVALSEEGSVDSEELSKKATEEMNGPRAIDNEENSAAAWSEEHSVDSEETSKKAADEMILAINIDEENSADRILKEGDLKSIGLELEVGNSKDILIGNTTL